MNVFSNRLQELDVRNLFALKELVADDNSLKTLDLTDNPLDDGYGFTALNNYLESVTLPDSGMQYSWKKYLMTQEFPRGKETGYKHQWYTDAAKQNPIDPETTETIQFNGQTLYAEYLPIRYTVEFNAGTEEVTGSMESLVLQYGDSVQLPEIAFRPVNDEVEFAGWQSSKGKTYGNRQTISNLTDKDGEVIRFTAKWKDKNFDGQPYQIVLKDGASTETQEGKYGESYELQSVSFAKDHYHLAGWALSEGGPKAFSVNASLLFSKPSEIGGGTLTLYAVWEKDVYRVEFEDTPSHISPVTVAYDETVALPDPGEKTGYTFEGWYTQRIGGEQWQADDRVSLSLIHISYTI